MSRHLDRAFNTAQQKHRRHRRRPKKHLTNEQDVSDSTATDHASLIISAFNNKDYLRVLQLPLPDIDELGNPVWPCTKEQITKSYRRLTLLVHPDKNPSENAKQAFHLLNETHKILLGDEQRKSVLNKACEVAREEKEKQEAKATVDEIIQINSQKIRNKRKLEKLQQETFNSEIVRQQRERLLQKKLKKDRISSSVYSRQRTSSETVRESGSAVEQVSAPDGKNDEKEEEWTAAVMLKNKNERRKPRFIF